MALNGHLPNKRNELSNNEIRANIEEERKAQIVNEISKKLSDALSGARSALKDVQDRLDLNQLLGDQWSKLKSETKADINKRDEPNDEKRKEKTGLSQKEFRVRDSELTELFKTRHISTIYNIIVAILLLLFLSTVVHGLIHNGSIDMGFYLVTLNFSRFTTALALWSQMMICTCGLYFGYIYWAKTRVALSAKGWERSLFDKIMLSFLIVFMLQHIIVPCWQVLTVKLPFALSMAVMMEQVRLLMKIYAFIRTNVPRTMAHKPSVTSEYFVPTFQQFFYYLFVPTLIYKDEYPRTSRINWGNAAVRFGEVIGITFTAAFIANKYLIPRTKDFGKPGVPPIELVSIIIDNSLPGIVMMVCIFYGILHSWLNGMAELLRFADRMFYRDWWNTSAYAVFYKTWNIVVYDWLYTFLYLDASYVLIKSKNLRPLFVIFVSAIFHEFIMAFGLGFFLPAFIVIYGFGGTAMMKLSTTNHVLGNIWLWFSLCLGSGIFITMYLAEYYVRINCPREQESPLLDFLVPRLLTCPYS